MCLADGVVFLTSILATAVSFFTLGLIHARAVERRVRRRRRTTPRLEAMRDRSAKRAREGPGCRPARRAGRRGTSGGRRSRQGSRARMVAEIKEELQSEMGLLPLQLLRDRRSSFVELYSDDNLGKTNYGTAGYLGGGYFVTVKHAVVALQGRGQPPGRAQDRLDQDRVQRQGDPGEGRRHRRRRGRGAQRRLGHHQDARARSAAAQRPTPRSPTTSPSRSSGSATTTRRASSSRPATSARGRRTAW